MHRILLVLALVAISSLLVACDSDEESLPSPNSGIRGLVLLGPQCPVFRENSPCPDEPLQATIDVYTADRSRKVASVTSADDGRFSLALAPGDYYLDPLPPDPGSVLPVGSPATATVTSGNWTEITISYDTGIR